MTLSDQDVEEFRQLCFTHLGLRFSTAKAREEAENLLRLYELLVRPLPSEQDPRERRAHA